MTLDTKRQRELQAGLMPDNQSPLLVKQVRALLDAADERDALKAEVERLESALREIWAADSHRDHIGKIGAFARAALSNPQQPKEST